MGGWVGCWPIRLYCHPQSQLGLGFGLDWGLTTTKDIRMLTLDFVRQGNDRGTQYRSGIYYHTEEQKEVATAFIQEVQPKYKDKIVVEVKSAEK